MALVVLKGVVENGEIRPGGDVALPEHARVYVLIPDAGVPQQSRIASPRLARPERASALVKKVLAVSSANRLGATTEIDEC